MPKKGKKGVDQRVKGNVKVCGYLGPAWSHSEKLLELVSDPSRREKRGGGKEEGSGV